MANSDAKRTKAEKEAGEKVGGRDCVALTRWTTSRQNAWSEPDDMMVVSGSCSSLVPNMESLVRARMHK